MKRILTLLILNLTFVILPAVPAAGQTTYNLQIMWQKGSPDKPVPGAVPYWGYVMCGGDLNADGYSDIVSYTDSIIELGGERLRCKIYIFHGGPAIDTLPDQVIVYDSIGAHPSLCIADFNHDGYNDLAIGDDNGVGASANKGCVNIHYGNGVDVSSTPGLVIISPGSATNTSFGVTISAGDINGDGIDDLIVGAYSWGVGNSEGRVYVYYGDTLGLHTWPDVYMTGHGEAGYYEFFGHDVSSGDDMNGDGYDDILVGAHGNCKTALAAGKVYVYYGGAPMDTVADGWVYGEGYEQTLGVFNVSNVSADTAGFNAVGWFGTPIWPSNAGDLDSGKCYMIPGDVTGEITPLFTVLGNNKSSGLGCWSSSSGYSDKDKLEDLVAGAAYENDDKGAVYLWLRKPTMNSQYDAYILGRYGIPGAHGDVMGASVAKAGDVDGDGKDEFLISNYWADSNNMIWLCKYTGPDGIEDENVENVKEVKLLQNVPNPFTHTTTISFQLPQPATVTLKVYNIAGQLVKTLVNEDKKVGSYEVKWNGCDERGQWVSNGIYIYQLKTGGRSMVRRMICIR
ncbi:FG-GAP repeat protein [candidate division TA06 bacterium]|uniref:FG-GAP repeat protein n=1 Tax=candidate division TA06 bacterium TaxID=2250710 RepID=A0A933ML94_UNCT6|nr:FG-GAP repeat protein [candidate division TA06 bacterium]